MAKRVRYSAATAVGLASFFVAYGVATAACVSPTTGASQANIDRVMASPASLLERFPEGQGGLVSEVRNFVATNSSTLGPISGLIPSANADQRRAIGAGLGQAAAMCARAEPETARRIQEAILAADSREVSLAFQGVVGDRPTAAVGPGGSGASSGGLGGGGLTSQASTSGGSGVAAGSTPPVVNSGYTFGTGGGSSVSPTSGSGSTYTAGAGSSGAGSTSGTSGSGGGSSPSIVVVSNNTNNNVNNVSSSSSSSATAIAFGSVSPYR